MDDATVFAAAGVPEHAGLGTQVTLALHPAAVIDASEVNINVSAPLPSVEVKVGIDNVPDKGPYNTGEDVEGPL